MSITDAELNDLRGSRPSQTYDGEVHLTTEEFWAILARLDDAEGAVQHEVDRLRSANLVAHKLKSARDAAWEELRAENARLRAAVCTLYEAIAHGDDAHKLWLYEAIEKHFFHALAPDAEARP